MSLHSHQSSVSLAQNRERERERERVFTQILKVTHVLFVKDGTETHLRRRDDGCVSLLLVHHRDKVGRRGVFGNLRRRLERMGEIRSRAIHGCVCSFVEFLLSTSRMRSGRGRGRFSLSLSLSLSAEQQQQQQLSNEKEESACEFPIGKIY